MLGDETTVVGESDVVDPDTDITVEIDEETLEFARTISMLNNLEESSDILESILTPEKMAIIYPKAIKLKGAK